MKLNCIVKTMAIAIVFVLLCCVCLSSYLRCDFDYLCGPAEKIPDRDVCTMNSSCMDLPYRNARFESAVNHDFAREGKMYDIFYQGDILIFGLLLCVLGCCCSSRNEDKRPGYIVRMLI